MDTIKNYTIVAENEEGPNRQELRHYDNGDWVMVRMRSHVDGGWLIKDSICVPAHTPVVDECPS